LGSPNCLPSRKASLGYIFLPSFLEVMGSILTALIKLLIASALIMTTGLVFPCSEPITGSRTDRQIDDHLRIGHITVLADCHHVYFNYENTKKSNSGRMKHLSALMILQVRDPRNVKA